MSLKSFSFFSAREYLAVYPRMFAYAFGVFVIFFSLYFYVSYQFSFTNAFNYYDVLFELDTPRVVVDMASFQGDHHRTVVHPLYVILANPLGCILAQCFGSSNVAAAALNSFLGALGVMLGFIFFWTYSKNRLNALLLATFFALTASQFILSVVPETSSFAIISLILNYTLLLHGVKTKKLNFTWWVIAGILSLGITTTNFAQSCICFFVLAWFLSENKRELFHPIKSQLVRYGASVVGITMALSLLQRVIYPESSIFFNPRAYGEDSSYINFLTVFENPGMVFSQLGKSFFIVDFIPPLPYDFFISSINATALTFSLSWNFLPVAIVGIVLWLSLLLLSTTRILQQRTLAPFFLGLFLCLLFNILFHSIYGTGSDDIYGTEVPGRLEYFMFSGNFHFLILAFLAPLAVSKKLWLRLALAVLIILTAINNYAVFTFIYEAVQA